MKKLLEFLYEARSEIIGGLVVAAVIGAIGAAYASSGILAVIILFAMGSLWLGYAYLVYRHYQQAPSSTRDDNHTSTGHNQTVQSQLDHQASQFYPCFIGYSSEDKAFAERLHADLQQNGARCWFAPQDMKIGAKIRPTIDEAIRSHEKLLLVLSKHSLASQWIEQEVETALAWEREQEGKLILFPVRLDNTVMEIKSGWPALIQNTRYIGDFRNWEDSNAYQKALVRLLRDLKESSP